MSGIPYIQIERENFILPHVAEAQRDRLLADENERQFGLIDAYVVDESILVTIRTDQIHPNMVEHLQRQSAYFQSEGTAQLLGAKIRTSGEGFDAPLID